MTLARARLALAALLFALWVSWLAGQAIDRWRHPLPVVAPAQLSMATADWAAALTDGDGGKPAAQVTVREVLWGGPAMPEGAVEVVNLPASVGYRGPGVYLLPVRQRNGRWEIALPPRSPGVGQSPAFGVARIYPDTPAVWRQERLLRGGK